MTRFTRIRKNFLPAFSIALVGWLGLALIVFYLSPQTKFGPFLFYFFFILANLFSWSLIIGNTKTGLMITFWLTWLLVFSHRQQLTWLTGLIPIPLVIFAALPKKNSSPSFRK